MSDFERIPDPDGLPFKGPRDYEERQATGDADEESKEPCPSCGTVHGFDDCPAGDIDEERNRRDQEVPPVYVESLLTKRFPEHLLGNEADTRRRENLQRPTRDYPGAEQMMRWQKDYK